MSSSVMDDLGITCPSSSSFYVCSDKPTRFVGCCSSDPCSTDSGACPTTDLRATSFNASDYDQIRAQDCLAPSQAGGDDDNMAQWYTCASDTQTFMGCCISNPCADTGICPQSDLAVAVVSNNAENAQVFLGNGTTTTSSSTSSSSSSTSATSTSSRTASASDLVDHHRNGLSVGAKAGIAVGVALAGLIVLGIVVFIFWRRRVKSKLAAQEANSAAAGGGSGSGIGSPQDHHFKDESKMSTPYTPSHPVFNTHGSSHSTQHPYGSPTMSGVTDNRTSVPSQYGVSQQSTPMIGGFADPHHQQHNQIGGIPAFTAELPADEPRTELEGADPRQPTSTVYGEMPGSPAKM